MKSKKQVRKLIYEKEIAVLLIIAVILGLLWVWDILIPSPPIENELLVSCDTDADCEKHILYNQCKLFCINKNEANLKIIKELEKTKTCDPTLWFAPVQASCRCIDNKCQLTGETQQVTIFTDKTEYEQGEEITASLNYESEIYQWGNSGWSVQRLENGSWITIQKRGDWYFTCTTTPECNDVNLDEIEECPPLVSCERASWYKVQDMPKDVVNFGWDQSYNAEEKTFQCKIGKPERVVNWSCIIFDQVPQGSYKIRFEYALSINLDDIFDRDIDIKYLEKEIMIK